MSNMPKTLEALLTATREDIGRAMSTLFRFGRFEAVEPILKHLLEQKGKEEMAQLLKDFDDGGHSLLHWASKRIDDSRFIQKVVDLVVELQITEVFNVASKDNVGMRPLHWACTEGSIPHVALLLKHGADMEAKDTSGCTPLLIAAQYGQVEVVAYLLKNGANIQAVDSSRDSALHWAAYKGSIQVCGLLSFYNTLSFETPDAYGQTPLHLASLRGHTSVVRYILLHLHNKSILFLKDKNDRTPLDLAIHKNRPTVKAVLEEAMAQLEDPRGHFLRKTLFMNVKEIFSIKTWKTWMGISGVDEIDEPSRFPFYFVLLNFAIHISIFLTVFIPVTNPGVGIMWDLTGWLFWNIFITMCAWYYFYKTVKTPPGYIDDSLPSIGKWRRMYEETLEAYADEEKAQKVETQLCHTCHVARPLRSKHCRVRKKCVLLFDHFCPFVDNTIGLYNYRFFFIFLVCMTLAVLSYVITFLIYLKRYTESHPMPWGFFFLGLEVCMTSMPIGGMLFYHTQLSMTNLSTNEHLNVQKYRYFFPLRNGQRKYKNPWFKGWMGNIMDRMNPSESSYTISEDYQSLLQGKGDNMV